MSRHHEMRMRTRHVRRPLLSGHDRGKQREKTYRETTQNRKYLKHLKHELFTTEINEDPSELLNRLERKRENGEISEETYMLIKETLEGNDRESGP